MSRGIGVSLGLCMVLMLWAGETFAQQATKLLWEIGKADVSTAEFALAPNRFGEYKEDALFVVGWSDPARDWPYAHPGPVDPWAGSKKHTFTIVFALAEAPTEGKSILDVRLVDTHSSRPPAISFNVNGTVFRRPTPRGAGDASIQGDPTVFEPHTMQIPFSSNLLKVGENEIAITIELGSWMLYDYIALKTPEPAALGAVSDLQPRVGAVECPPLLCEEGGVLMQVVRVPVRHLGDPREIQLRIDDGPTATRTVSNGLQTIELRTPAVDKPTTKTVTVSSGDQTLTQTQVEVKPTRAWTVYLLHHTHLDIGYTHHQSEVEARQWSFLDQAIELGQKTREYPPEARFKWLPEGLWAVDSYLRRATPEQRDAFIKAARQRTIGLDALYGNELTALCRPEELLELTGYARRLAAQYDLTIDSAMISDVPGYTWGTIPALAWSGVKFFSIGPNRGHRIGYTLSEWGDKPFYWVSPSGKQRVLCWIHAEGYSWFHRGPFYSTDDAGVEAPAILEYLSRLQEGKYPYDIAIARYNIGGDNGPPDPNLPDFVRAWNEQYASPKIVIATVSEAFGAFEERYGKTLPQHRGDFTPYWEDGAASSALETIINRAAAERLVQAQALWPMLDPGPYPAADFQEAWRNIILYDEHTWGAHNSISEPESEFALSQWRTKQAFALDADRQTRDLMQRALAVLQPDPNDVRRIAVFNTASWPRADIVVLPADWKRPGDRVLTVDGAAVPSQRLSMGELAFLAKDVPALGSAVFTIEAGDAVPEGDARAEGTTLSAGGLMVEVDPASGAIVRLSRGNPEANLIDTSMGLGLNDYLYVAGRDPASPQRASGATVTVKEAGPLLASLLVESAAPGCRKLTREIRIVSGLSRVDLVDTLDKENIYEKEAVHIAFPFNLQGGTTRMDTPFAVVRPDSDQMTGSCKNYFTVQRWVDVSSSTGGVTLATPDAPLFEVGAITCDPTVVGWLKQCVRPRTTLYAYIMNNYWETNYKASQEGLTTFRFSLRPHGGYDPVQAHRFGIEQSQPLIVSPVGAGATHSGVVPPLFAVKTDRLICTALKPADTGDALIVRLHNVTTGQERLTRFFPGIVPEQVNLCTISEKPGRVVHNDTFVLPGDIVTLRFGLPLATEEK